MANVISTAGYRNVKLDLTTATATKLYSVPTNYVTREEMENGRENLRRMLTA